MSALLARSWFDLVERIQNFHLPPRIERILDLPSIFLILSRGGGGCAVRLPRLVQASPPTSMVVGVLSPW